MIVNDVIACIAMKQKTPKMLHLHPCIYFHASRWLQLRCTKEYSNEGKSGKSVEGRPQFQQMLQDIESGKDKVDFVLVFKLSRFGQNAANVLSSLQRMQDFGVNLICVEDGIDSSKDGVDDLRWFFIQLGDLEEYVKLNQQLFDFTIDFNIYDYGLDYDMPVYFISGSCDWVCPVDPIREYAQVIQAPNFDFLVIDGPGHHLQYSTPMEFADVVKYVLEQ